MKTSAMSVSNSVRLQNAYIEREERKHIEAAQQQVAGRPNEGWLSRFLVRMLLVLRI